MNEGKMKLNRLENLKPKQKVIETSKALYVDDFKLGYVVEGSVKTKKLSQDYVEVTLTFLAKSYEKRLP